MSLCHHAPDAFRTRIIVQGDMDRVQHRKLSPQKSKNSELMRGRRRVCTSRRGLEREKIMRNVAFVKEPSRYICPARRTRAAWVVSSEEDEDHIPTGLGGKHIVHYSCWSPTLLFSSLGTGSSENGQCKFHCNVIGRQRDFLGHEKARKGESRGMG